MKKIFLFICGFIASIVIIHYFENYQQQNTKKEESEICWASWYGPGFHGKKMANGEIYNQYNISVAHKTLPLGTFLRVTNLGNNRSIIAPVTDRGPYIPGREVDLSYGAAQRIGAVYDGVVLVSIKILSQF